MTRKKAVIEKTGRSHSIAFKEETIALAAMVGVREAAHQLGLHESQLYDWRHKARERLNKSQNERDQATEIARLKRQVAEQAEELAIIKKAAMYFAKKPEVKYEFMSEHMDIFGVSAMVGVLGVSRHGDRFVLTNGCGLGNV